jgi:hypothetical protein
VNNEKMSELTEIITAVLGVATILGLFAMGVNAIRLLRSFRNGVLQKGWKYIAIAAFCLIYGIVGLDLSVSSWLPPGLLSGIMGYSGAAFQAIGGVTIAYGCKAQYDVWNPKGMKKSAAVAVSKATTSQKE